MLLIRSGLLFPIRNLIHRGDITVETQFAMVLMVDGYHIFDDRLLVSFILRLVAMNDCESTYEELLGSKRPLDDELG